MSSEAIAITGISALFAGSPDAASLWRNIVTGRDLISEVPPSHWLSSDYYDPDPQAPDKVYCQRGSFLDPVGFDALNFGLPPSNVPSTDTSQLLALILAERLFQDIAPESLRGIDRERISVILGVTGATELTAHMSGRMARPQWEQGLRDSGFSDEEVTRIADRIASQFVTWQESTFPGLLGNVVAGRIANRFDLGGTNCIVDAACASSLGALSMAVNELHLGQSDLVITGGIDTLNDPLMYLCFSKTPALSMTGDCRPFSDQADGTLLGEGLSLLALRRLSDAERDGDRIYAVIKGLGSSSDGRSKSVYAPRSAGQARALRRAYVSAGYTPASVELVEAHGTATKAGDLAEFEGLQSVFSEHAETGPWCALGSIKSQIGHTKAAAGVAGLTKAILSLHHKILPPTIKVQRANPQFKIESSPFYLNTEARPWIRGADHPRRASVSSFGFGGSNFHVALEEYLGNALSPTRTVPTSSELVLVSAATGPELESRLSTLVQECDVGNPDPDALRRLAQQSRHRFQTSHPRRCALVVESLAKLRERLGVIINHLASQPEKRLWVNECIYYDVGCSAGKIAWLFPGQGSQYIGMGRDLAMSFDAAREVWDRAASSDDLQGLSLHHHVFPPPALTDEVRMQQMAALQRMEVAQPAIAACSLAATRVLERFGIAKDFVAGHSFGELTAVCAAGVIQETQLLPLSRKRGLAMVEAASASTGMTAVRVSADELLPLLSSFGNRIVLANRNSQKQMVVSGECTGLDELEAEFSRRKWSYKRLDVNAACHSPWMRTAVAKFSESLGRIAMQSPQCHLGWNAGGCIWSGTTSELQTGLAHQLVSEVRFHEMIESLYAAGVHTFLEVGPAAVLTGLVNETLAGRDALAVTIDRKGSQGVDCLWQALGQLAVHGVSIDWTVADRTFSVSPTAPTPIDERRTIRISGANFGKPYPANRSLATAIKHRSPSESHDAASSFAKTSDATSSISQRKGSAFTPATRVPPHNHDDRRRDRADSEPIHDRHTREPFIVNDESIPSEFLHQDNVSIADDFNYSQSSEPSNDPWLTVFREVQQQTAQAHQVYLKSVSETHRAFLQATLGDFAANPISLETDNTTVAPLSLLSRRMETPFQLEMNAATSTEKVAPQAVSTEPAMPRSSGFESLTPHSSTIAEDPRGASALAVESASPNSLSQPDSDAISQLVLEVVADKTGYSVEVLDPDLEIEAGLGIDSIKRVEILSALVQRFPKLETLDLTEFAKYQTLGDVLAAVHGAVGSRDVSIPAATSVESPLTNLRRILLEVVSEKTGYPQDLLDLDMDIESGLGIDSIKRVEILSALIDHFPELSSVDAMEFNSQRTLRELLNRVDDHLPQSAMATSQVTTQADSAPVTSVPTVDHRAILLSIVSDKTGYPTDLLDLDMDIESGLGIDSIKRVEILSSLIDRFPELSSVDAMEFNSQRTLGELLNRVEKVLPQTKTNDRQTMSPAPPVQLFNPPSVDHQAILLSIISDKTGYPQDLLDLDMDIESGLGIDSIKRVEILSSLIDRFPELSSVDAMEFNSQRTLRELVNRVGDALAPTKSHLHDKARSSDSATSTTGRGNEHQHENGRYDIEHAQSSLLKLRGVVLVPSAASGFALPGFQSGAMISVVAGNQADDFTRQTANALALLLSSHGIQANVGEALPAGVDGVIHLGGLTECLDSEMAASRHWEVCEVAQRLKRSVPSRALTFVTVQDTGGRFGQDHSSFGQAFNAGLAGLAKTALREWPEASIKALDVERRGRTPQSIARAIIDELLFGGTELEVALPTVGPRATLCCRDWQPDRNQEMSPPVSRRPAAGNSATPPTFVVSGGARGVTAAALIALAKRLQPRFVLLGRTALSEDHSQFDPMADETALKRHLVSQAQSRGVSLDLAQIQTRVRRILAEREVQQTIHDLQVAGAEVRYLVVDVRDARQLSTALEGIRREWGPIRGLIHGAGVLADKRIVDKQQAQFQEVFHTKVSGLQALLAATDRDPLEWLALFSSITARIGNAGQSDYAAANEVLNKLAHHESQRRGSKCRVLSINWGAWNGGMVDDSLRGHFEKQGVSLIPLAAGAELFADLMLHPSHPPVELVVSAEPEPDSRLLSPVSACHRRATMELTITRFPFMRSHRVRNEPVLPLVLVVEWFARALRQRYPHLTLISLHDIKVLRGVSMDDEHAVRLLHVVLAEAHQNGTLSLQIELHGADDVVHYRSRAELASASFNADSRNVARRVTGGASWPWTVEQAYDHLFHGPDFHVLRTLDAVDETSGRATLLGVRSKDWEGGPWTIDPAAMDGALQVAILWGLNRTGRLSLPSSIKAAYFHRTTTDVPWMNCEVVARTVGRHQHSFDIHLTTPTGEPIVDLTEVDMTLLQSTHPQLDT